MLTNDEIAEHVEMLVGEYTKGFKMRPQDKPVLQAGVELVINLLQNINDIAAHAVEAKELL
jgi:hypothetical protein